MLQAFQNTLIYSKIISTKIYNYIYFIYYFKTFTANYLFYTFIIICINLEQFLLLHKTIICNTPARDISHLYSPHLRADLHHDP